MEFFLITETNERKFINKVNEYLSKGWKLHGNTFTKTKTGIEQIVEDGKYKNYPMSVDVLCQAMVKEEEEK